MSCSVYVSFFFFKQKTAYEMRISDWSSDVCSSDLLLPHGYFAVIVADQPGTLRNEENATRRAIVDILGHLRRDLSGKVGPDPSDQRGRNETSRLKEDRKSVV